MSTPGLLFTAVGLLSAGAVLGTLRIVYLRRRGYRVPAGVASNTALAYVALVFVAVVIGPTALRK